LGCSVIGEVTEGNYVCTFEGSEARSASDEASGEGSEPRDPETVVDCDAGFLGEGAPMNDLPARGPSQPDRDLPEVGASEAFGAVVGSPTTASKRWVYRQYDHEVQVRTARRPGDDAAILAVREANTGLAISAGADPNWTDAAPYEGARAVALENATNLAAKGATPLAAVDCLNGGNPEKPDVYGGFQGVVDGLAEMCASLDTPVVGGNVSLYNDSPAGPIPPTPTLALVGTKDGYGAPPLELAGEGDLLLAGDLALAGEADPRLGGSEYLAQFGGSDRFPALPGNPRELIETIAAVTDFDSTLSAHDVSHGGLAVSLAEMVHAEAGADVRLDGDAGAAELLCHEQPGRVVIESTNPDAVREAFEGIAPVTRLGAADETGTLDVATNGESVTADAARIASLRSVIADELE
ncbi:MAG: AIR synthase related protein, partial [Haloarculaceae archaeon]